MDNYFFFSFYVWSTLTHNKSLFRWYYLLCYLIFINSFCPDSVLLLMGAARGVRGFRSFLHNHCFTAFKGTNQSSTQGFHGKTVIYHLPRQLRLILQPLFYCKSRYGIPGGKFTAVNGNVLLIYHGKCKCICQYGLIYQ